MRVPTVPSPAVSLLSPVHHKTYFHHDIYWCSPWHMWPWHMGKTPWHITMTYTYVMKVCHDDISLVRELEFICNDRHTYVSWRYVIGICNGGFMSWWYIMVILVSFICHWIHHGDICHEGMSWTNLLCHWVCHRRLTYVIEVCHGYICHDYMSWWWTRRRLDVNMSLLCVMSICHVHIPWWYVIEVLYMSWTYVIVA